MRLSILVCFTIVSLGGPLQGATAEQQKSSGARDQHRPNLIFILTDDQRWDAIGANHNPSIHTPHLDAFYKNAVRLTNAAVVMSLCSPSRAAALTGRYNSANGVTGLGKGLRPGEVTFGNLLKQAGYQTAFVGKWHLKTKVPEAGFDFRCYFQGNGTYWRRRVWDNDHFVKPREHVDAFCAKRSVAFLKQAVKSPKPFVLFHATQLPHMNHQHRWPSQPETRKKYQDHLLPLPKSWRGDLTGKPRYLASVRNRTQAEKYGYKDPAAIRKHTGDYYSVITEMDAFLGRLFRTVEQLGLSRNTYIIFMSDNGWFLGEHRFTSKVLPYDPSMRVPLAIVGPGLTPRTEERIALNIDIAPTLLDLADVKIPKRMHGQSLVPLLRGKADQWRESFVYECLGSYGGSRPTLAAVTRRWKLIHTWDDAGALTRVPPRFVELYDLQKDPHELKNLAGDPRTADVRRQLASVMGKHLKRLKQPEHVPLKQLRSGKDQRQFSGIYPHLASFNRQNECGTGAVVPWADKLWWITYAPHKPGGSDDKLYATNDALDLLAWPGSVGGTPANRMIHRESQQLFIGPYVIDREGKIRVISPRRMPGRLTGNARHLNDPANKIYYATMEEGFYEVDVKSLTVKTLFPDAHRLKNRGGPLLPGHHGKGLYSGQGRLIYANNGEMSKLAKTRPDIPSGVLAEWRGKGKWKVVRRNQFTEVTGPGGIVGNRKPDSDPVWSIGWDHRSLILMVLDAGKWHAFRLPKASHCYDGAHGWNTEWPRIRDIGEDDLLMTMHGMFWRFPKSFRVGQAAGIAPRSSYLKVIGDFARWKDRIVFGCDDSARVEFLNTRKAKGQLAGPEQSQSNLWFVQPGQLDQLGPALGRGAVWENDAVKARTPSDPFLFHGFKQRSVHLSHDSTMSVTFRFEIDKKGDGTWTTYQEVTVPAKGYRWLSFSSEDSGQWIRVIADRNCRATAWFEFRNLDRRKSAIDPMFSGLGRPRETILGGLVRAGDRETGLQVLASRITKGRSQPVGYYELKPGLKLVLVADKRKQEWMAKKVAIPGGVLRLEGTSILYIDDKGQRFRLPVGNEVYLNHPGLLDIQRAAREVATERDLFQCAGTFFELPARNAGGFAKIRAVATHPYFIQDYCSWRGLMVLSGLSPTKGKARTSEHIIRSDDGHCALWLGAIDDLWKLGKPGGRGGPWSNSNVRAGQPSDPYLMAGYDVKTLTVSHDQKETVKVRIEVDTTGTGNWQPFRTLEVSSSKKEPYAFPAGFHAYWVRLVSLRDCKATALFEYR